MNNLNLNYNVLYRNIFSAESNKIHGTCVKKILGEVCAKFVGHLMVRD